MKAMFFYLGFGLVLGSFAYSNLDSFNGLAKLYTPAPITAELGSN